MGSRGGPNVVETTFASETGHIIAIHLGHFHDVISNTAGYWGKYEIGYCERPAGITLVTLRLLKSYGSTMLSPANICKEESAKYNILQMTRETTPPTSQK